MIVDPEEGPSLQSWFPCVRILFLAGCPSLPLRHQTRPGGKIAYLSMTLRTHRPRHHETSSLRGKTGFSGPPSCSTHFTGSLDKDNKAHTTDVWYQFGKRKMAPSFFHSKSFKYPPITSACSGKMHHYISEHHGRVAMTKGSEPGIILWNLRLVGRQLFLFLFSIFFWVTYFKASLKISVFFRSSLKIQWYIS